MSVRTAVLAAVKVSVAGNFAVLTVPAGETWILKSMYLNNFAVATNTVSIFVTRPSTGIAVNIVVKTFSSGEIFTWDGWMVLAPGDQILGNASATIFQAWVSGSRLIGLA